jgi:hypothetical protein
LAIPIQRPLPGVRTTPDSLIAGISDILYKSSGKLSGERVNGYNCPAVFAYELEQQRYETWLFGFFFVNVYTVNVDCSQLQKIVSKGIYSSDPVYGINLAG